MKKGLFQYCQEDPDSIDKKRLLKILTKGLFHSNLMRIFMRIFVRIFM